MKVFLSWSGPISKQVATFFDDWIKNVIQEIETFISTKDISVGDEWRAEIDRELANGSAGVFFITPDNISSAWLHFEAGALSKDTRLAKIMPVRVGVSSIDVQRSPISKFQTTDVSREGMLDLVQAIAKLSSGHLARERVERSFDRWWTDFESFVTPLSAAISATSDETMGEPAVTSQVDKIADGIADILALIKEQRRPTDVLSEFDKSGLGGDLIVHKGQLAKSYGFARDDDDDDDYYEKIGQSIIEDLGLKRFEIIYTKQSAYVVVFIAPLTTQKSLSAKDDPDLPTAKKEGA